MPRKNQDRLDPDIRFLLANERTLLAWIRTSLAIQAGGLALAQLHSNKSNQYLGVIILLLGGGVTLLGYIRFRAADQAIRNHHLPHPGRGPLIQVTAVIVVAIVLAIVELTRIW